MEKTILISPMAQKHVGKKFKKILLVNDYKVTSKYINHDETDIMIIDLDYSVIKIDATFHELSTNDNNLIKTVTLLKRLQCLSEIDTTLFLEEYENSFKKLNEAFLYIQIIKADNTISKEKLSLKQIIKKYHKESLVRLDEAMKEEISVKNIIFQFQKYTNAIYFEGRKKKDELEQSMLKTLRSLGDTLDKIANDAGLNEITGDLYPLFLTEILPSSILSELEKTKFETLLHTSLSLGKEDKIRIINAIPDLSKLQFDEFMKVLLDEQEEFESLKNENPQEIKRLQEKAKKDWKEIKYIHVRK